MKKAKTLLLSVIVLVTIFGLALIVPTPTCLGFSTPNNQVMTGIAVFILGLISIAVLIWNDSDIESRLGAALLLIFPIIGILDSIALFYLGVTNLKNWGVVEIVVGMILITVCGLISKKILNYTKPETVEETK